MSKELAAPPDRALTSARNYVKAISDLESAESDRERAQDRIRSCKARIDALVAEVKATVHQGKRERFFTVGDKLLHVEMSDNGNVIDIRVCKLEDAGDRRGFE